MPCSRSVRERSARDDHQDPMAEMIHPIVAESPELLCAGRCGGLQRGLAAESGTVPK